jgi:hypothetical protein
MAYNKSPDNMSLCRHLCSFGASRGSQSFPPPCFGQILVTHQLQFLRDVDQVIVLGQGVMAAKGTFPVRGTHVCCV